MQTRCGGGVVVLPPASTPADQAHYTVGSEQALAAQGREAVPELRIETRARRAVQQRVGCSVLPQLLYAARGVAPGRHQTHRRPAALGANRPARRPSAPAPIHL